MAAGWAVFWAVCCRTGSGGDQCSNLCIRLEREGYNVWYDNGQRADGIAVQTLRYEEKPTKGPDTVWDAPGMVRIKIPWGGVSPAQLDVLADLSE